MLLRGETLRVLENFLIWTRRSFDCDTVFLPIAKPLVVREDGVLILCIYYQKSLE